VGGKYDFGWSGGPINILEIEPGRKLSYSWHYGDDPETIVTWALEGSEGGTRLTLVHSGFAPDRPTHDYTTGWHKFVNDLKSMIEIGSSWTEAATDRFLWLTWVAMHSYSPDLPRLRRQPLLKPWSVGGLAAATQGPMTSTSPTRLIL
jgi:hypothetical protein